MTSITPVIHWFRRDLRLNDNLALHSAILSEQPVLPIFIFDPAILKSARTGSARLGFLLNALRTLDASLKQYQSGLLIQHGDPLEIIPQLIETTGAQALYFNRDYSPFALHRDERLVKQLRVPVYTFDDAVLIPPGAVVKPDKTPYTVYTPYMKQWQALNKPAVSHIDFAPTHFQNLAPHLSMPLPTLAELGFEKSIALPPADEETALHKLGIFARNAIYAYSDTRNDLIVMPFENNRASGPSALSVYLRLGLLSPRQVYWAAREAFDSAADSQKRESVSIWINELIWREFYIHILHHFPHVNTGNFRREYDALEWRYASDELDAWKNGKTGYPVVDAAMRQLEQTGWLPNRARMIVASFLTKDLLIHWQEGERYFMQRLIDGDPAANNGGWQWTAGTGTDAQPCFRIFNPVSQSQKFDPSGAYLRYWIPELQDVPDRFIHTPWEMPTPVKHYPPPIVQHDFARERVLAAFNKIKKG